MNISSFLASGDFCILLITFAKSLDPDQDLQNVSSDLDTGYKHFDTLIVFLKENFENVIFENSHQMSTKVCLLLMSFANSWDPDQDRQNVGLDLDPTLDTLIVLLKEFFEKVDFENSEQTTKKVCKFTHHAKSWVSE